MADDSFQEKTEQASPRKRREAREKGNVPKSQEVNTAVVLLVGMLGLKLFGGHILSALSELTKSVFLQMNTLEVSIDVVPQYAKSGMRFMGFLLAPFVGMIMFAGIGANILQSGWVFSANPMKPKFEKISPAKGIKKMFSSRSAMELFKSIMKVIIIGFVGYNTLKGELFATPHLIHATPGQIIQFISVVGYRLAMNAAVILIFLAALDYAFQKRKYEKDLRMTKQELREEYKRTEGDPLVKARIRSIQRERARRRMLSEVPKADVVITNPTTYAIALKYTPKENAAPVVVAKGARLIAQKIKDIAKESGVPVIENKPLARSLYAVVQVGAAIPFDMYKAVAEILAYVYRLKNKKRA